MLRFLNPCKSIRFMYDVGVPSEKFDAFRAYYYCSHTLPRSVPMNTMRSIVLQSWIMHGLEANDGARH